MRQATRVRRGYSLAMAISLAVFGCAESDHGQAQHPPGARVETENDLIGLLDLDGNAFDLWHDREAHATVVVFTRSDCPVSNRYAPEIRKLYDSYHARGVGFYLIYVDPNEPAGDVRNHLREYEYPCRGLRDPRHVLVAHTGATTTPEAVVFDRERKITYRGRIDDLFTDLGQARAAPTKLDLADALEATLAGRAVAEPVTEVIGCPIQDLK